MSNNININLRNMNNTDKEDAAFVTPVGRFETRVNGKLVTIVMGGGQLYFKDNKGNMSRVPLDELAKLATR